jgi:hypothetical protein
LRDPQQNVTKIFQRFYLLLQSAHHNQFDFKLRVFTTG